jgi:hypothetical protein
MQQAHTQTAPAADQFDLATDLLTLFVHFTIRNQMEALQAASTAQNSHVGFQNLRVTQWADRRLD